MVRPGEAPPSTTAGEGKDELLLASLSSLAIFSCADSGAAGECRLSSLTTPSEVETGLVSAEVPLVPPSKGVGPVGPSPSAPVPLVPRDRFGTTWDHPVSALRGPFSLVPLS